MNILVTGGAGFIGSQLVHRLVPEHTVTVIDNFSLGKREFLADLARDPRLTIVAADLLQPGALDRAIAGCDVVFHLAANSDIRAGTADPYVDVQQGILATYHVLEAMRAHGVRQIVFTSSSAVYGLPTQMPTPEDYGPLTPISQYGASKLAAEGLISAYGHLYGWQAWMCRLANIVGQRMTHGALCDFLSKLTADPTRLEILGDGRQCKAYLHVADCVEGILFVWTHANERVNLFNVSTSDAISVQEIAAMLSRRLGLDDVAWHYTGTAQGWAGDVPRMRLDTTKLTDLGWRPSLNSRQAVAKAIEELLTCKPSFSQAASGPACVR